jgi:hypothetical protein
MAEENSSPSVQKPVDAEPTLTFPEAMTEVSLGKKIHKLEWKDKEYYGILEDEKLKLHKPDGKTYDWIISEGDLNGDDWVIV